VTSPTMTSQEISNTIGEKCKQLFQCIYTPLFFVSIFDMSDMSRINFFCVWGITFWCPKNRLANPGNNMLGPREEVWGLGKEIQFWPKKTNVGTDGYYLT